ncbi:MAG: TetR/AcrR family transcriptional regulator [Bacteroidales bacterium]|nr:TetR/AcrR family transcriptional regulator [Bacteroidales bacterium]
MIKRNSERKLLVPQDRYSAVTDSEKQQWMRLPTPSIKGKSSIYYYYQGKEEIFEAVVLHEANQLRNPAYYGY